MKRFMMIRTRTLLAFCVVILAGAVELQAQTKFVANYDESKVPQFELPNPLQLPSGTVVKSAAQWEAEGRGQILDLFTREMFGRAPGVPDGIRYTVESEPAAALDGRAIRKQIAIHIPGKVDGPIHVLMYVPAQHEKPVPVFLGLNFQGNHTVQSDPGILMPTGWVRAANDGTVKDHRATEKGRGKSQSRWPASEIVKRGYGLVTAYYGDIDPDFDDGFKNGVHSAFATGKEPEVAPDAWGSISAWAWGLSRIVDYLETDQLVDSKSIVLMGHSRLGKTSLWAGAQDERFRIVISNNSGCGGAALSKRAFGETVGRINSSFPHWFNDNFQKYNRNEEALTFDQHMLIALIAPRPVLVCSAEEDRWADPRGEFLAARGADPVYRLLGTDGMSAAEMPGLDELVHSTIGYRIRPGRHNVLLSDWQAYMDFADKHLSAKP